MTDEEIEKHNRQHDRNGKIFFAVILAFIIVPIIVKIFRS